MKFRKKPVEVEAVLWTGHNLVEAITFVNTEDVVARGDKFEIVTLEGTMTASPGDWIIRGVHGEFYPCKPDIFDETYEPVTTTEGDQP